MSNMKQKKKNRIIAIFIIVVLVITSMGSLLGVLASMI